MNVRGVLLMMMDFCVTIDMHGKNNGDNLPFTSARDIGNMAAGYIAGLYGLSWELTRLGFDGYQSIESGKISVEGLSSQNAQMIGFTEGLKKRKALGEKAPTISSMLKPGHIFKIVSYLLKK